MVGLAISREGTFFKDNSYKKLRFGLKLPENFNFLLQNKAIDIIAHFDLTRKFMRPQFSEMPFDRFFLEMMIFKYSE